MATDLNADFLAGKPIAPGDGAIRQIVYWNQANRELGGPALIRYQTTAGVTYKLAHHPLATDAESVVFSVGDEDLHAVLNGMARAVGALLARDRRIREIANQGRVSSSPLSKGIN